MVNFVWSLGVLLVFCTHCFYSTDLEGCQRLLGRGSRLHNGLQRDVNLNDWNLRCLIYGIHNLLCEYETQSKASGCIPTESSSRNEGQSYSSAFVALPHTSTLKTGAAYMTPSAQRWTECWHCGLEGREGPGQLPVLGGVIFDPENIHNLPSDHIPLSESRWSVFFSPGTTLSNIGSVIEGRTIRRPFDAATECTNFVDTDTYVFHLLTWHVGHLIIDVLEPLYRMLWAERHATGVNSHDRYINRDIIIVLDVDAPAQKRRLHLDILQTVYSDTAFRLLRAFTRHPIHTMSSLAALPGVTCFRHLYLGLDVTGTYLEQGQGGRIPALLDPHTSLVQLENLNFTAQVDLFRHTRVLIGQYGSGLHNVPFLTPGSAVVVLMQPGWCSQLWHIGNQAAASGVDVFAYCFEPEAPGSERQWTKFAWSRRSWEQGPMHAKNAHYSVPPEDVTRLLRKALAVTTNYPNSCTAESYIHAPDITYWHHPVLSSPVYNTDPYEAIAHFHRASVERSPERTEHSSGKKNPKSLSEEVERNMRDKSACIHSCMNCSAECVHDERPWVVRLEIEVLINFHPRRFLHDLQKNGTKIEFCLAASDLTFCSNMDDLTENDHYMLEVASLLEDEHAALAPFACVPRIYHFMGWLRTSDSKAELEGSRTYAAVLLSDKAPPRQGGLIGGAPVGGGYLPPLSSRNVTMRVPTGVIHTSVSADLKQDLSLQLSIRGHCQRERLDPAQCFEFAREFNMLAAIEEEATRLDLPAVQVYPTAQRPLIFYHLQKTGGSNLRRLLVRASREGNYTAFVPCYDTKNFVYTPNVNCLQFDLSALTDTEKERLEVVALHPGKGWDVWRDLPSVKDENSFDCVTMLRHPVSRVISFYYDRVYGTYTSTPLNDLTVDELNLLLDVAIGVVRRTDNDPIVCLDDGMKDAACKMMCGAGSFHGGQRCLEPMHNVPSKPYSFSVASERLGKCVIGVLENWKETQAVFRRWLPWLEYLDDEVTHEQRHYSGAVETLQTLKPELYDAIVATNKCDMALYEFGLERFSAQMNLLQLEVLYRSSTQDGLSAY